VKRILILLAFPLVAFAQGQPTPEQLEANDRLAALAGQRDEQANRVVLLTAELAKVQRALEAAKKECKPEDKK